MTGSGAASLAAIAGRPPADRRSTAGRPSVDRFRPAAGAMSEGCPQDVRRTSTGQKREDQDRARPRSDLPAVASRIRRRQQPARVLPGSCSRCGAGEPGKQADAGLDFSLYFTSGRRSSEVREAQRVDWDHDARGTDQEGSQKALRRLTDARSGPGWITRTARPEKLAVDAKRPARRSSGRVSLRVKANGCSTISRRPALSTSSAGCPQDVRGTSNGSRRTGLQFETGQTRKSSKISRPFSPDPRDPRKRSALDLLFSR